MAAKCAQHWHALNVGLVVRGVVVGGVGGWCCHCCWW